MTRYAKAIASFLTAISTWGVTAAPEGITGTEWFGLLGVLGGVVLVYAIPNSPPSAEPAPIVPAPADVVPAPPAPADPVPVDPPVPAP